MNPAEQEALDMVTNPQNPFFERMKNRDPAAFERYNALMAKAHPGLIELNSFGTQNNQIVAEATKETK